MLSYVLVTRIGHLEAARLGVSIGAVPVFLTDICLILLVAMSFLRTPLPSANWCLTGRGMGIQGGCAWFIVSIAAVHCVNALADYGILALKDFAIFGYAIFFPFTCLAISTRRAARRLLKVFVYGSVALAGLVLWAAFWDTEFSVVRLSERALAGTGRIVQGLGGGDVGGMMAFGLAALGAYALLGYRRLFHLVCGLFVVAALALNGTRSAIAGVALAAAFAFVATRARHRVLVILLVGSCLVLTTAAPLLPGWLPGAGTAQDFYSALASTAALGGDDNLAFRLQRWSLVYDYWADRPFFGVGFGAMLVPLRNVSDHAAGHFNAGMPHNTFLMILARVGLVGLAPFLAAWLFGLYRIFRGLRKTHDAHALAAGCLLVAMLGYAPFVLFFERPMHGATFWIMLAAGWRLSGDGNQTSVEG